MFIEAHALSTRVNPIFGFTEQPGITLYNPKDLKDNHVLILHGGADISPALYNKPVAPRGGGYHKPTKRDQEEWDFIKAAIERDIPIIGICRGAQMLCAYAGGSLIQDISGHTGQSHKVYDLLTKTSYISNSCHHQMMVPPVDAEIIASCFDQTIGYDEYDNKIHIDQIPEVIHFPTIRALGIQGHPEWMSIESPFVKYCKQLIQHFLLKED